ncbi:MBL fold metallo-hydrolase [Virgibacillus sp. AGTR]|uniref:MBL fold metallo-hydrolase n=1 Tax=Virgibacillus salarius TaxID=447199 RepID=A0A941E276_9BACI|nr:MULTISPECIES: MBL fold metallo-hydrolase [Bacillaceae]NAZ10253.1 MBL fold metallo-hydrolase [Agaribacter marinus]MBR7797543.1 MBL fold metallo-hydrolase [Virgibacillus salarius]MCC2252330.1 MBL fold metallo-hydrolase [Virgibacillus sp. AGTR]MDY7046215.1 MBL fold metallo-hydrolase [Virgibacillus sp. M23]QRZ20122.1 MBL fold metallo-hydrolase [Virgibacillus sp. AGTR]
MQSKHPIHLDNRIRLIDGFDLGVPNRTGTYVIDEEQLTIVETGPSPSVRHVKNGLEKLGFQLDQVKYIIVTHIHLDHAGGAGLLIRDCPNASVIVHPRGERHLIDPKRLAAGARAVYGDSFSELFEPIVPVDADRIIVKGDGDTLEIGSSCMLEFLDTPGHAKHHFCIYDPISNGVFTGDTVGVRYQQLIDQGVPFFLPSTSPNQFNPDAMQAAIARLQALNLDRIYYGHFGMTNTPNLALQQVANWLPLFLDIGQQVWKEGLGYDELAKRLLSAVKVELRAKGIPDDHEAYIVINLDMQVCALGIIDFFKKLEER